MFSMLVRETSSLHVWIVSPSKVCAAISPCNTTFPAGMPTDLIQHIFDLIISCDTVKYVIMYPHGPVTVDRLVALGEVR
jgi:hypothetical protein